MMSLYNALTRIKMMKQEQERQEQDREIDKRRVAAYERDVELRAKPKPAKTPDWLSQAIMIAQETGEPLGQVVKRLKYGKPEKPLETRIKEKEALTEAGEKVRQKYKAKSGMTESAKETKRRFEITQEQKKAKARYTKDQKYISTAINRLNKERDAMFKIVASGGKDKEIRRQEGRIANLDKALAQLDALNAKLLQSNALAPEDIGRVQSILSNLGNIKEGAYNWETGESIPTINEKQIPKSLRDTIAVNPQTGERGLYINNVWTLIKKK